MCEIKVFNNPLLESDITNGNIKYVRQENSHCGYLTPRAEWRGLVRPRRLCGLFMCNQWKLRGTQITTQSTRRWLPSPPCWSERVLRVYGDEREGRAHFHTQAISFGTEPGNLLMKDHFP